ncbi:AMP-binding protein, partial [Nocardioides sp. CF8]|uniref:AMP-binding protein n=1 Tax=Nocardioides sp. CF8 TaxID=110319 RepID=UPI0005639DA3
MDHVELREGSRVALLVPGSHDYVDLVISLLAAGTFPVPLDPALTPAERERVLAPIAPDLVVTTTEQVAALVARTPDHLRRALPRG